MLKRRRYRKEAWKIKGEKGNVKTQKKWVQIRYSKSKAKAGAPLSKPTEKCLPPSVNYHKKGL